MRIARGGIRALTAVPLIIALMLAGRVAAETRTSLDQSANLSFEYDNNVLRTRTDKEQDLFVRLLYALDLVHFPSAAHRIEARYMIGGKKYMSIEREDTLVNSIFLGYVNGSFDMTQMGASASFKLRNTRDGDLDYDKLILDAFYQRDLPAGFGARASAGYDRFDYINLDYYDYWVHRYNASISREFSRNVVCGLEYGYSQKRFAFGAYRRVGDQGKDVIIVQRDTRRIDDQHSPTVWIDLRWRVRADVGYSYRINDSNSYGESYSSHVLSAAFSVPIIDRLAMNGLGILQWRAAKEEVSIPHTTGIEDEEEHLNTIALRATLQAHKILSIEAGYSRYWSTEPNPDFRFVKDVVSVGFKFNF